MTQQGSFGLVGRFVTVLLALSGCGSGSGVPIETCGVGGSCPNGTVYQACGSADGKSCSFALRARKFQCASCSDCANAQTQLTAACDVVQNGPFVSNDDAGTAGPKDMSSDMAHSNTSVDFSLSKLGCNGYASCMSGCFAGAGSTTAICTSMCSPQASSAAPIAYLAALGCGQTYCLGTAPEHYKCKLDAAMTSLVNLDGTTIAAGDPTTGNTGTKDCRQCLTDALARLFGYACSSTSSADCSLSGSNANITMCGSTTTACLSDLP